MKTTNNDKRQVIYGAGFDIGTGFSNIGLVISGRLKSVKLPVDGDQVPSAVFIEADGTTFVGSEALLRAWKDPSRLYTYFKPQMFNAPDESVNGGPTRVELTGMLIKHMVSQLLAKMPELAKYPQFGGTSEPAEDLVLAFTVPAGWGIPQQDAMRRAIKLAGINLDVGELIFVAEPKAGCRQLAHEHERRLSEGDTVLCVDKGSGTTDVIVLRIERGVWHEQSPPLGDQFLGGRLFTAAIALLLCKSIKAKCSAAFSLDEGLSLGKVNEETERETALNIWMAAEEAKIKLSTAERAAVFIQTTNGKREASVTLTEAQQAWAPLWVRMEKVVSEAMKESGIVGKDIKHVYLIGGSALLSGLRSRIAALLGRSEGDVLVSDDSAHVVSNGAAEEAYHREESDQILLGGCGLRMRDSSGARVNRVFLRPNHTIPAGGQEVEQMGQWIRSPGGSTVLFLEPFIAKPGVRCADPLLGLPVTLDEREIIALRQLTTMIELPEGDHEVSVGVSIDTKRDTNLIFTPVALPDYEPIVVPLSLGDATPAPPPPKSLQIELALIVDCSRSMQGEKLNQAKIATEQFVKSVRRHGVRFSLIKMSGEVEVVCPLSKDLKSFLKALSELEAAGGTLATEAFELTEQHLAAGRANWSKMVVFFSDGLPGCAKSARVQAQSLKKIARVLCVGIGQDASRPFLQSIASCPEDYFEAQAPQDILGCLCQVAELIHNAAACPH